MIWRIRMFGRRCTDLLTRWPLMLIRWWRWLLWLDAPAGSFRFARWLSGFLMLTTELSTVHLWYMTLRDLIKWNTRPLRVDEIRLVKPLFGDTIPYHLISMDPQSYFVRRGLTRAYVSFYTIHFSEILPDPTLVHEMVHIWQFRKMGSAYITEALFAQGWGGGYDYGGLEPLVKYSEGAGLGAFNVEQQADIIEDYFRWSHHLPLQWAVNTPGIGNVLASYARELTLKK